MKTAVLSHPQVGGQSEDRQAKHREDGLQRNSYGKPVSHGTVDDRYLYNLETNHDKPGESRREHTDFAPCEDGCCGKEETSTYENP
ncbi:MAG TPA: hypothetical protein VIZ68_06440, partial [Thermoplasmata archaeon]